MGTRERVSIRITCPPLVVAVDTAVVQRGTRIHRISIVIDRTDRSIVGHRL